MIKGKVKWYNDHKGYGFIKSENGEDVFVHRSNLVSSFYGLQSDQEVEFDTKQGEKGTIAINVKNVE